MMKLSDTAIRDIVVMALAEDMGLLDEWRQKRDLEKAREIARGLKQDNVPFSVIVKNTGLPLQEVEAL